MRVSHWSALGTHRWVQSAPNDGSDAVAERCPQPIQTEIPCKGDVMNSIVSKDTENRLQIDLSLGEGRGQDFRQVACAPSAIRFHAFARAYNRTHVRMRIHTPVRMHENGLCIRTCELSHNTIIASQVHEQNCQHPIHHPSARICGLMRCDATARLYTRPHASPVSLSNHSHAHRPSTCTRANFTSKTYLHFRPSLLSVLDLDLRLENGWWYTSTQPVPHCLPVSGTKTDYMGFDPSILVYGVPSEARPSH